MPSWRSDESPWILCKDMSGDADGQADGAGSAQVPNSGAAAGAVARRSPEDSTLLLPTPSNTGAESKAESLPIASQQENDVPCLSQGESLAGRFTILRFIA